MEKVLGKRTKKTFGYQRNMSPGKIRAYLDFLEDEGSSDSGPLSGDFDSDEADSDYEVIKISTSLGKTPRRISASFA